MAYFEAQAALCGVARYPNLRGSVRFFAKDCGTVVQLSLTGLPCGGCQSGFHGLYVEEGCAGSPPRPHGGYVLPPVLNAGGVAVSTFYTAGFRPEEVAGRRLLLTANADCFERGGGAVIASGLIEPCPPHGMPWPSCGWEQPRRAPWEDCFSPPRSDCCRPSPPCPPLFPQPRRR